MKASIKKPLAKGLVKQKFQHLFKSKIKQLIVLAACWGLLPLSTADWLIQSGGMRND